MNTNEYEYINMSESKTEQKKNMYFIIIPSFLVFFCGLLMLLCAFFINGKEQSGTALNSGCSSGMSETSNEAVNASLMGDAEYYVIKSDPDGYISVYLSDGKLYRRLDIPAYTLPMSDRAKLEIGIMVKSDSELDSYIDGFSG